MELQSKVVGLNIRLGLANSRFASTISGCREKTGTYLHGHANDNSRFTSRLQGAIVYLFPYHSTIHQQCKTRKVKLLLLIQIGIRFFDFQKFDSSIDVALL